MVRTEERERERERERDVLFCSVLTLCGQTERKRERKKEFEKREGEVEGGSCGVCVCMRVCVYAGGY